MKLRHAAALPALALALARHKLAPPNALRILLLHDIGPGRLAALDQLVGFLARAGRLAGVAEAEAMLAGTAPFADKVLLSFDDGFADNRDAAATVLTRHGATALFFVCPGLMALAPEAQQAAIAANVFDGKREAGELTLMGWDEVAALAAAGHRIGNHTLGHRRLTRLGAAELEDEIGGGAAELTRRLGQPPAWFAFPFGDIASVNGDGMAVVARYHRWCRSGVRGGNDAATPPLALRADHLDLDAPWPYQRLVLEGGLDRRYGAARARLDELASPA